MSKTQDDIKAYNKKFFETLLRHAGSVFVGVDSNNENVVLPSHFSGIVTLQVGYDMAIPIPDLETDDEAFRCTLSFDRCPFHCTVPWDAVRFMNVGGPISPELEQQIEKVLDDPNVNIIDPDDIPRPKPRRALFKVIDGDKP